MKTNKPGNLTKRLIFGILTFLLVFLFSSCSKHFSFLTSSVVPAAEGTVNIKKDRNKNYVVRVQIADLAEVDRLQGNKVTYVVWLVSDNERIENVGQLKSKRSLLTKQLKATIKTVSPSNPIKVFVTAENDGSVIYPIGQVVLSTDRF
jgi:hypothetical protein